MILKETDTAFEVYVTGRLGLFTDPLNRITAEKISYEIPTYAGLQGVMRSIYSDPCIEWFIDECRVLNQICYQDLAVYNPYKEFSGERVTYHYLYDCAYVIKAHFDFNYDHPELSENWIYEKHKKLILRAIKTGGRMHLHLGVSECQAFLRDIPEGGLHGHYDNSGIMDFGLMFHSYRLANSRNPYRYALLWRATMENGIIHYCQPQECPHRRKIKIEMPYKPTCQKPISEERNEFEFGFVNPLRRSNCK